MKATMPRKQPDVWLCLLAFATVVALGSFTDPAHAQLTYSHLHSFGLPDRMGMDPYGTLIEGNDGALYGTFSTGGPQNAGSVFTVNKDGTDFRILHQFQNTHGSKPLAGVIEGSDGRLYGTAYIGGPTGQEGTVFRLEKNGNNFTVLHDFAGAGDGQFPYGALLEGSDGYLYGVTEQGGNQGGGTVFRLKKDGQDHSVLHTFGSPGGQSPLAALIEGSDGFLYGTAQSGGSLIVSGGIVFRLRKNGADYEVLHIFGETAGDGLEPISPLLERPADGMLYGTTFEGGNNDRGTIFRMNKDGTAYEVLYHLLSNEGPFAEGVIEGPNGLLFGSTQAGGAADLGTIFKFRIADRSYTVLHEFGLTLTDGQIPVAGLLRGSDGVIYDTTLFGGCAGRGTLFKLNDNGTGYTVLLSFSENGGDGRNPRAEVIQGSDGKLYGAAYFGGCENVGAIFRMNNDGTGETVLYNFSASGGDGQNPAGALLEASDGKLYGTTQGGGNDSAGTVFRIQTDGNGYMILRHFSHTDDKGRFPYGGLIEGSDGKLYGTTLSTGGGDHDSGVVFKIDKDGNNFTVLHYFLSNGTDEPERYLAPCQRWIALRHHFGRRQQRRRHDLPARRTGW
jgi:uncharacterized repeat protein (TIGR03803 family)